MADPQNKGTVLYVEDEESDVLFMQAAFKKVGLTSALHIVGDGREAMDYLSGQGTYADRGQNPMPEVVLLDLNLPLISGIKLLQWMRSKFSYQAMPVVVFSSSSDPDEKQKCLQLGANEFLEKPKSPLLFVNVVQRLREKFLGRPAA